MLFREVFLNDELIGFIGWNEGIVLINAETKNYTSVIESLKGPIIIDTASKIGDVSVSEIETVMMDNKNWLGYLDSIGLKGLSFGMVNEIEKKRFIELVL